MRRRALARQRLQIERFDLLVIGGGITGAGVARDAVLRGLRTALVERHDFASGTSSRSSRLVHGGVRYLEYGHLRLVFESSRERRALLRIAPHLVRPLAFTWPVYAGARVGRWKLAAGMALYDALALFRNVSPHQRLDAAGVLAAEPALQAEGLVGGVRYFDAATDDARLTLANVIAAEEAGAAILNHAVVTDFVREQGRIVGATATDAITGDSFQIRAAVIVNATGPWSDELRQLESPGDARAVRGSKGSHIAVPRARVDNRGAVTLLHPADGRVFFAIPAGEQAIIGTTETATTAGAVDVRASRAEVRYLLDAANHFFPGAALADGDVISAWAGIRPLAASLAGADMGSTSREHSIVTGAGGVLHVTGGKLTTYRAMAEEIVDGVVDRLGRPTRYAVSTATRPLPGGDAPLDDIRRDAATQVTDDAVRERLVTAHGTRWAEVWELTQHDPALGTRLAGDLPYVGAEFVHAAQREMAGSLGDALIRRTPAAFQCPDHARAIAPAVARLLAPALGWDHAQIARELRAFDEEVERMFSVD